MNERDTGKPSRTDWARVDAMTDEDIDYSDIPATSEEELQRAQLRMPEDHGTVTLKLDPGVLSWFQSSKTKTVSRPVALIRFSVQRVTSPSLVNRSCCLLGSALSGMPHTVSSRATHSPSTSE